MTFEVAVEFILEAEGGESNHPKDSGGRTKFGISAKYYPMVNLDTLTEEQAVELYRRDYWDRLQIGKMPPEIRLYVFDAAVNQGPGTAIRMLQKAVGAREDGLVGPSTLHLLKKSMINLVVEDFKSLRMQRYAASPGWETFGHGWSNRVARIDTWTKGVV